MSGGYSNNLFNSSYMGYSKTYDFVTTNKVIKLSHNKFSWSFIPLTIYIASNYKMVEMKLFINFYSKSAKIYLIGENSASIPLCVYIDYINACIYLYSPSACFIKLKNELALNNLDFWSINSIDIEYDTIKDFIKLGYTIL